MQFLDGTKAKEWIAKRVKSGRPAILAVAFWGDRALEELGFDKRKGYEKLTIICNLKMGGTNPSEIKRLMALNGIKVRQSNKLHGKVYLFEGKQPEVLIGSSNASTNGLAFQGKELSGWHEANLQTNNSTIIDDARKWLSKLDSREINDASLQQAEKTWETSRKNRAIFDEQLIQAKRGLNIIKALAEKSEALRGRELILEFRGHYDTSYEHDKEHESDTQGQGAKPDLKNAHSWEIYSDEIKFLRKREGKTSLNLQFLKATKSGTMQIQKSSLKLVNYVPRQDYRIYHSGNYKLANAYYRKPNDMYVDVSCADQLFTTLRQSKLCQDINEKYVRRKDDKSDDSYLGFVAVDDIIDGK